MASKPKPETTVRDVAAYLSVDVKSIFRLAQRGELPGFKVAGAWRFQGVDLERWIETRKQILTAVSSKGSKRQR